MLIEGSYILLAIFSVNAYLISAFFDKRENEGKNLGLLTMLFAGLTPLLVVVHEIGEVLLQILERMPA